MACGALTKGRGLDCNRISGGIKYIYFGVLDQFTAPIETTGLPVTAGEVTDLEMGTNDLYRYTMPLGVASITDTIVGSREDQNQIKLLGATKVVVFAQLNQQTTLGTDIIVAMGVVNGMELNAGTIDSGAAWGDKNGYTLTFDGMEQSPMPIVADYPIATGPFTNAGFNFGTIVTS